MTETYLQYQADVARITWYFRGIVAIFVIAVIASAYLLLSRRWEDDDES